MKKICATLILLFSQTYGFCQDFINTEEFRKSAHSKLMEARKKLSTAMRPWCTPNVNLNLPFQVRANRNEYPLVIDLTANNTTPTDIREGDEIISINSMDLRGKMGSELFKGSIENSTKKAITSGDYALFKIKSKNNDSLVEHKIRPTISCKGIVWISKNENYSRRYNDGFIEIPPDRLNSFNDDELTSLVAWNMALFSLRSDMAPTEVELEKLVLRAKTTVRAVFSPYVKDPISEYLYNEMDFLKVDFIAMLALKSINVDLKSYSSMLEKIDTFQKNAKHYLLKTNSYIDHGNPTEMTSKRIAELKAIANDIDHNNADIAAKRLNIRRPIEALSILDKSLLESENFTFLGSELDNYLTQSEIQKLQNDYKNNDQYKLLIRNDEQKTIIYVSNIEKNSELATYCGPGLRQCRLLAAGDFNFERKAEGREKSPPYKLIYLN